MDASSTPNQGTEPETLEDLPQLGASISRRPQFNKSILLILALAVVGLLVVINGGFTHGETQQNINHHYTIADHLGKPPELPKASDHSTSNSTDTAKPDILHTGNIATEPHYTVLGHSNKTPLTPKQRKQTDALLAFSQPRMNKTTDTQSQRTQYQNPHQASELTSELQQKLQPTKLSGSLASRIVDPNLFITKGAFLDCILETAISSDVPGMTRCQLSRDIYSTNGKVLLLEKGSHIVGQYQGGLQQGVARIFVLWDRIETPNGVIIDLDSAGTDTLGRSGHSGFIDGHFKQRFGSAMLLSLINDVGQYASNKANSGNKNQIQFGNTIGGTKDLASIALQDSIGIKPTLLKNQGEHINVFVARDLDFRSVYDLQLAQ
ncbi:type IV secretion system protein VirB10 [Shewanella sp. 202IG2-18]|uniref:type IV secretion system protein VirB10 n=1 Tax=Parashewanella hymeniacidonis TaxID=2807618 RepID=UPI0019619FF6|nr:type IV secretion system protein VirB10 [Parashewanella hymeniacidonis]MBM7073473.1 type IV secretion system protein VirB10 [Parashewanella hymeniacidonis]